MEEFRMKRRETNSPQDEPADTIKAGISRRTALAALALLPLGKLLGCGGNETKEVKRTYIPALSLSEDGHIYLHLMHFSGPAPSRVVVTGEIIDAAGKQVGQTICKEFTVVSSEGKQLTDQPVQTKGGHSLCGVVYIYDKANNLLSEPIPISRGLDYGNPTEGNCPQSVKDAVKAMIDKCK